MKAVGAFAACLRLLAAGTAIAIAFVTVGALAAGVTGLAIGAVAGSLTLVALLAGNCARRWPDTSWKLARTAAPPLVALAALLLAHPFPGALGGGRRGGRGRRDVADWRAERMRILHLALEDHLRPGSGGGSLRNREINTRLAAHGHDVHVVTAAHQATSARGARTGSSTASWASRAATRRACSATRRCCRSTRAGRCAR